MMSHITIECAMIRMDSSFQIEGEYILHSRKTSKIRTFLFLTLRVVTSPTVA